MGDYLDNLFDLGNTENFLRLDFRELVPAGLREQDPSASVSVVEDRPWSLHLMLSVSSHV